VSRPRLKFIVYKTWLHVDSLRVDRVDYLCEKLELLSMLMERLSVVHSSGCLNGAFASSAYFDGNSSMNCVISLSMCSLIGMYSSLPLFPSTDVHRAARVNVRPICLADKFKNPSRTKFSNYVRIVNDLGASNWKKRKKFYSNKSV
jgi:hypothetical protein